MGLYDGIKDIAKVIQKADNIELYQKLLDLGSQALDMQDEIARLKTENTELKQHSDLKNRIERHETLFVTLQGENIKYCAHCWDADEKLIKVTVHEKNGQFRCPHCKHLGTYDNALMERYKETSSYVMAGKMNHFW